MPKYLIERTLTGIGNNSETQMQEMAQVSNDALKKLNGEVTWLESFVTDNSSFCVYVSPNEELIRRHAQLAGFPIDRIIKVDTVIDPSTGESKAMPGMMGKEKPTDKTIRQ